jgi:hypothetical protein
MRMVGGTIILWKGSFGNKSSRRIEFSVEFIGPDFQELSISRQDPPEHFEI